MSDLRSEDDFRSEDVLKEIFREISAFINERKAVSEDELRMKIGECIASIGDDEREALKKLITDVSGGDDIEDVIFRSVTTESGKISVFSPDVRTRINYQGEIFYCLPSHRFFADELEEAFLRASKMRNPPSSLKVIVEEFLTRCGYEVIRKSSIGASGAGEDERKTEKEAEKEAVAEEEGGVMPAPDECVEISAVKIRGAEKGEEKEEIRVFIFPSIKFVQRFLKFLRYEQALLRYEQAQLKIVVPTERTPAPFISFFRHHSEDIPDISIWVVDIMRRTVNPLCGRENDEEIERNFSNAKQARKAVSMWMRKMPV